MDDDLGTYEQRVIKVVKEKTGEELAHLHNALALPVHRYRRIIEVVDEILSEGRVPSNAVFGLRTLFHSRHASQYYRKIFEWRCSEPRDETEKLNYDDAVAAAYSKAQAQWTWEQLQGMEATAWPTAVLTKLAKDLGYPMALIEGVMHRLDSPNQSIIDLDNILQIKNDRIFRWFVDHQEGLPKPVRKRFQRITGIGGPTRAVFANPDELSSFLEVWSEECDEEDLAAVVAERSQKLGWEFGDLGEICTTSVYLKTRWTELIRIQIEELVRCIVVQRDDESTLEVYWLERI